MSLYPKWTDIAKQYEFAKTVSEDFAAGFASVVFPLVLRDLLYVLQPSASSDPEDRSLALADKTMGEPEIAASAAANPSSSGSEAVDSRDAFTAVLTKWGKESGHAPSPEMVADLLAAAGHLRPDENPYVLSEQPELYIAFGMAYKMGHDAASLPSHPSEHGGSA